REDLFPWPPLLASTLHAEGQKNCPSVSANLWVFAAINISMLVLAPLLGRRSIVYKISNGRLGRPDNTVGVRIMGPLTAGLQVLANWINIAMIKKVPGYSGVSTRNL